MKRNLTKIIKEWKDEAGVKRIIQINACFTVRDTLTICTDRPIQRKDSKGISKHKENCVCRN